ncbi:unnamed protein product [Camellia sinensis]
MPLPLPLRCSSPPSPPPPPNAMLVNKSQVLGQDKPALIQQRLSEILGSRSPGSQFNDPNSSDVKLTLSSKEGLTVSLNVHRQILVAHNRFFAVKLSDRWSEQQRTSNPYIVEIADCDDVEVYIEALSLMYCKDLRKKLMKEDVTRVLGILKIFDLFDVKRNGVIEFGEFVCSLGGRLVYQNTKKRASGPKYPVTGKRIQWVNVGWMSIEGLDFEAEAEQKNEHIHQNI